MATGAQTLDIDGNALNIANLTTFDASAATGNVTAWFFGRGTGALSATGGSGVNDFVFGANPDGTANFTAKDSVNGGTGANNTLSIEVETGAILLAGVGSNITNIHTIEQISGDVNGHVTGDTSADMSLAGSATVLALDANYRSGGVDHNVTVTNLTNADTVTYGGMGPDDVSAGVNLGTLTLSHATPIGLLSTLSFTMDSTATVAPLDLTVDHLVVAATSPALAALNVDSTGNAATNEIFDVSGVAANVVISGGTDLEFGDSFADGYTLLNGTIDATASTGNVTTFLSLTTGAGSTTPAQTFIAGHGTDMVSVNNGGGDVIDFSVGGTDTVQFFKATATGTHALNDATPQLQ